MTHEVERSDEEWRTLLTPEQYRVMREKGTESPFTGVYHDHHGSGTYRCAACDAELFRSTTKFDTGCGWPSFWEPISGEAVERRPDTNHGMVRTEVTCAACGAHLGHVFEDGPEPTGERFCINSVALDFKDADGE